MKNLYIKLCVVILLGFFLNTVRAAEYSVDRLNRVTQASYAAGQTIAYEYDAAGNILAIKPKYTPTPTQPQVSLEITTAADQHLTNNPIAFKATLKDYPASVSVTQYGWDWNGDGTVDENGLSPTAQHTYTQAGSYNVSVTATDSSGGKTKSPTASLTVTTPTPQTAPDLVATVVDFYQTLVAGQQIPFITIVRNIGTKDAPSGIVRVYASTDSTITSADSLVGSASFIALPASGYQLVGSKINAPSIAGRYWFGTCVDVVAGETNTSNNCSSGEEWVVSSPVNIAADLSLTNLSFFETADAGQQEPYMLTLSNTGNQTAVASSIKLYASTDATVNSADTVVGTIVTSLLPSSSKQDFGGKFTVLKAGNYWFAACVDAVAGETNTSNNCTQTISKEVWATGTINSITPTSARLGQLATFTVQGSDMANTLALSLSDCNNVQKLSGGTATEQKFTCLLTGSVGSKAGELRNYAGGVLLKSFVVNATSSLDNPDLAVSISNPTTITSDTFTKHTVTVQNLGKADAANVVLVVKTPYDSTVLPDGSTKPKAESIALATSQGIVNCPLSTSSSVLACQGAPISGTLGAYYKSNIFTIGTVKVGQVITVEVTNRYSGYATGASLAVGATVTTTMSDASLSNNNMAQLFVVQAKRLVQGCDYTNAVWVSPYVKNATSHIFRPLVKTTSTNLPIYVFGSSSAEQAVILQGDGFVWKGAGQDSSYPNALFSIVKHPTNSRYVGVSAKGGIYWSDDQKTWSAAYVPSMSILFDIEYFNGRYIAVGEYGAILTSIDGINWSQVTSGVTNRISYVDIGNNELIAGGWGVILKSANGTSWDVLSNTGATSRDAWEYGAVWNGSQYLLFDMTGHSHFITTNLASVNTILSIEPRIDGQVKPANSGYWYAIRWQDNEYVALTSYGVLTSKDGYSWITKNISISSSYGIMRMSDKVVIVGAYGSIWVGACSDLSY